MGDAERIATAKQRWEAAAHAMQSGVAVWMDLDRSETDPKHLRVGINVALRDHGSLAFLLVRKGIMTEVEYFEALADGMEQEAANYATRLSEMLGAEVNLQ